MRAVYEVRPDAADGAAHPAGGRDSSRRRPPRGGDAGMSASKQQQVSELLHEAAETHHRVYRIVDGADDDWASWYANWLTTLSELPGALGTKPPRSEITYLLVALDKEFTREGPQEPWERYYARRLLEHFA